MAIIAGIDFESTGLDWLKGDKFVEVCIRCYDMETRKLKLSFAQRINPMRSIGAQASAVHNIYAADLVGQPTWEVVAPKLNLILGKCDIVVAHNGYSFDFPFMAHELLRVGLTPPTVALFDTMVEGRWATDNGKVPNLRELCFATDVKYDASKAHGAEYDVEILMQSYFRGVDLGFFKSPEEILEENK